MSLHGNNIHQIFSWLGLSACELGDSLGSGMSLPTSPGAMATLGLVVLTSLLSVRIDVGWMLDTVIHPVPTCKKYLLPSNWCWCRVDWQYPPEVTLKSIAGIYDARRPCNSPNGRFVPSPWADNIQAAWCIYDNLRAFFLFLYNTSCKMTETNTSCCYLICNGNLHCFIIFIAIISTLNWTN